VGTTWVIIAGVLIGVVVGWMIGWSRGRPVLGALLGVFGLIGWVVMFFVPRPETFPAADEYDLHHVDPRRPEHPHRDAAQPPPSTPPDTSPT
jgi:membrane associated rhomboid family serine protease